MRKIICFDLEGPLSAQDHAYEVMKWIPGGEKIFEVISRYDDLLTLEGREDYEGGNTLKLIVPFLDLSQDLLYILDAWEKGGRKGVKEKILKDQSSSYHWLKRVRPKEFEEILKLHKHARKVVRGEAAKLG